MSTTHMPAGRELDALIAQKVMGWRNVAVVPATGEPWGIAETAFPSQHGSNPVPEYSTDIVAAMLVLEHWKGDCDVRRQNGSWRVSLYEPSMQYEERNISLPLAICRAALAAVGES